MKTGPISLILAVALACGCQPAVNVAQRNDLCARFKEICSLDVARAKQDAQNALSSGDARLLGINVGVGWYFGDGVDSAQLDAHGYRIISEGAGDEWENQEHGKLIRNATKYADAYNAVIVSARPN